MFYNILEKFLLERVHPKKTICFSDGAASQYKNRKNFINLCLHEDDFGISAEWHFYATSHGKGAFDGVGGSVKRLAARGSLQKPYNDKVMTPRLIGRSQLCHLFTLAIATRRSTKEYKILLSNASVILAQFQEQEHYIHFYPSQEEELECVISLLLSLSRRRESL